MAVCTHRFLARATIEFVTGFRIGTGRGDHDSDAGIVTDANGLALIPGTSLTGVLRETMRNETHAEPGEGIGLNSDRPAETDSFARLFGFQGRARTRDEPPDGQGSRLSVDNGHVHDRENRPTKGLLDFGRIAEDEILAAALSPERRHHVRLSRDGAVDGDGKFDERVCPAGLRFTFDLELEGREIDTAPWERLLSTLARGTFRIGGGQRRGLGRFKCIGLRARSFDLVHSDCDWEDFVTWSRSPEVPADLLRDVVQEFGESNSKTSRSAEAAARLVIELPIRPKAYWMFGGGDDPDGADIAPARTRRVVWPSTGPELQECFLIPFSSVKGSLRHRTAFYLNKRRKVFADTLTKDQLDQLDGLSHPAVGRLFGRKNHHRQEDSGQPGSLQGNDIYLPVSAWTTRQQAVPHVAIDPLTGGAISGALFHEKPFWSDGEAARYPPLRLEVTDTRIFDDDLELAESLALALQDLATGHLPLGNGSGRGLGRFEIDANPSSQQEVLDRCLAPLAAWARASTAAEHPGTA
ncbi:MAG: hypothetical protein JNK85_27080 [Verrucomicrobiales bacterium]|nr:hypothetical protein [Verrucomicrobiales bacterium]